MDVRKVGLEKEEAKTKPGFPTSMFVDWVLVICARRCRFIIAHCLFRHTIPPPVPAHCMYLPLA